MMCITANQVTIFNNHFESLNLSFQFTNQTYIRVLNTCTYIIQLLSLYIHVRAYVLYSLTEM